MQKRISLRGGFTLVELLVVIAIIGILATLIFPAINRARANAKKTACNKKLGDIYKVVQMYANASFDEDGGDGLYPEASSSPGEAFQAMVVGGFMKDPAQVKCPAGSGPTAPIDMNAQSGPSFDLSGNDRYVYYAWANTALSNEDEDPTIPLSGDRYDRSANSQTKNNHKDGRNILLTTGKVEYFKIGKQDTKLNAYLGKLIQ